MILEFLDFFITINHNFAVLNYLTTRVSLTLISSLLIVLFFGKFFINQINSLQFGQIIRKDGIDAHHKKSGTPTMGGILIIFAFVLSVAIWSDLSNQYVWVVLFTAISFAILGFVDDYLKIKYKSSDGLSSKKKFLWQAILGSIIIFLLIKSGLDINYLVPFVKDYYLELGLIGFVAISLFLIIGFSNGVNLADGLDGLAIMPVVIIASGLALFAYISSNINFSAHLNMEYMAYSSEMLIILAALIGSGLGFLWFNAYPAEMFMGDVGSLSLGAILIVVAIILRQEIIFIFMGFIFVVETLSVIIQVGYFKYSGGKRVFLMAPIHHHFEKKGLSEPKIIIRGWLITIALVLIALATIKIR